MNQFPLLFVRSAQRARERERRDGNLSADINREREKRGRKELRKEGSAGRSILFWPSFFAVAAMLGKRLNGMIGLSLNDRKFCIILSGVDF